ncbi:hypothetical protein L596_030554 [Steinernema carpocapsae]|uniref:Uncharacterized protein n=1 Tax=Steinernema carpocapsae TaxID=34508 RepID=A0A4U5LPP9_STECR|nr:hypothetical protein L596_030554 [Steinernema carpocapsae]
MCSQLDMTYTTFKLVDDSDSNGDNDRVFIFMATSPRLNTLWRQAERLSPGDTICMEKAVADNLGDMGRIGVLLGHFEGF